MTASPAYRLDQALRAAGIPIVGVSGDPPDAEIRFAAEATQQHRDDAAAIQAAFPLTEAKRRAIEAIDARSSQLLTAGLEVAEGVRISTSTEAQINFLAFRDAVKTGHLSPPQGFSTLDDGEFVIETAEQVEDIYAMWLARKKDILDAGRALRLAVLAAESVEAVNAITDDRE